MLERTLGQELVPQGRERVVKFMHWEILHRQEQGEAAEPQRAMQIGGPKSKIQRGLHFSAHEQLTSLSPAKRVGAGRLEIGTQVSVKQKADSVPREAHRSLHQTGWTRGPRDPHRSLQLASYGLQHSVRPGGGGSGKDPGEA